MKENKKFVKLLYANGTEMAININKIIAFTIKDGKEYASGKPCKIVEFCIDEIDNIKCRLTDELREILDDMSNNVSFY